MVIAAARAPVATVIAAAASGCFVEVVGGGLGGGAGGGSDGGAGAGTSSAEAVSTSSASGSPTSSSSAVTTSTTGTTDSSSSGGTCAEATIWDAGATPFDPDWNDGESVEVGVRFRSDVAGSVRAIRFYKGAQNTGTHVGNLWTTNGQLLASATFNGESATGWQRADFATPVPIDSDTTYVASYHAPDGYYAVDPYYFANGGVYQPPLRALEDGFDGPNGVYNYGASAFPTDTFNSNNYWVDVVFCAD